MMLNNSSHLCAEHSYFITDILLWKVFSILLPVLGIPGNVLIIIIMLNRSNRKHPISLYFTAIAMFEIIYLIGLLWDWLDVMSIVADPRKTLNCAGFYMLVIGTAMISAILLANVSIDRVIMILLPFKTNAWITHRKVTLTIVITGLSIFCLMIHYRFSLCYHFGSSVLYGQACIICPNARIWFEHVWPILYLTLFRVLPALIVIICAVIILVNRCSLSKITRTTVTNKTKVRLDHRRQFVRMQTLSIVLVLFSLYFTLSIMPNTIMQFFNKNFRYETDCFKLGQWKLLNTLFIMFESTSYTNKFYIKLIVSKQFRNDIKRLITIPVHQTNILEKKMHRYQKPIAK
ncbi:unnamed protein product [Didymodactylos carnosus]|uniref:G-protein coupled receptors family 1 profile domain-containing protein n=1 Tax=Didymodactylos carnosus TaxID=1234261 RepID=A0A814KV02_9BILA|nr:unnamed protein product [Didymodactylos carnosus]CAF1057261.1 unnamed protein product [Didymodactylos carnosus]CAF3637992.1 unnamed protein product [Didymodactylos carnosus]CAF3826081.1 unnamed protein product [Didymodactylos carnosus]